jgi:hypothetical protein
MYRIGLGASQANFGKLQRANRQPELALQWLDRAIETLEGVSRELKLDVTSRQFLRDAHWWRGQALDELTRYVEATQDWDRAAELSPETERPWYRMNCVMSRVRAGQVDAAVKEAGEATKNADANMLYDGACILALASNRKDESAATLSKEECASRAVALLQQAVAKGYKDVELMKNDDDLKALREREDFKKLVADLEKW